MAAKKKTSATSRKSATATAEPVDPRASLEATPKNLDATLVALREVLAGLDKPEEPKRGSLVDALVHAHFLDGLPCGVGQAVRRRIDKEFVDRNEFRVAEAFEVEALLADLEIPGLFDRCLALHESVQQVYNDQNIVSLDYLREASVAERKSFFQRVPAIRNGVADVLVAYVDWEDVAFSDRSTLRVQARLGLDAKNTAEAAFVDAVRELLAPFGRVPLEVGKDRPNGKILTTPELSPLCLLMRLEAKAV